MRCPQRRCHSYDKLEYREKIRQTKLGSKNPNWKGDNVGYGALHEWVRSRKIKPELCEKCKIKIPYDLANKSGKYKRDLDDWEWLCRKCHMEKDNRILNLIPGGGKIKRKTNRIKGWKRPDVSLRNKTNNPNKRR